MFAFPEYSYSSEVHDYFITVKIREDATAVCNTFLNHGDVEAFQVIEAADETAPVNYASSDGVLYNADYSTLFAYPQRRQEEAYTVAENTKELAAEAFYGSYYVEEVILPEGIESIPREAFRACEKLRRINIPESVTTIEQYAFRECYNLKRINIPDSVKKIETGAFQGCESLGNVMIGDGVEEIADIAFNSCYRIKTLQLGRNVTSIREAAFSPIFSGGASEASLFFAGADEQGELSATEHFMIEEMLIPVKKVTVAEDSFEGVDVRKVYLYSDTVSGSDSVFLGFLGTEAFEIMGPSSEGAEANYAQREGVLFDTEYKELVSYPKGRKDIEYRIPDEITDIHTKAFYNADYLERLYIPNSVKFIGEEAFAECDKLTIYCDADSFAAQYAEENGVPYSTQRNNIEFTLLKKYSVVSGEEPLVYDDRISDYDVVVTKDEARILGCKIYRGNIVLPLEQVRAGDVLKIRLTSKTGETLDYTTEVKLDDNGYAKAEFEIIQKGRFKVSPIGMDEASVLLFDMEGNRLKSGTSTTESYVSECYDAGNYQVMVIYGKDGNWPFETLAEFKENDYVGGTYTLKTIEIKDNVVTDLGEIFVEKIDVMSAVYLDEDSCYFANTDVVSQNGLIQVKAQYQFKEIEEEMIPQKLRITIPENCRYVSESMKVDGRFTDQVNETETELVVPITELDGTITFNLKPTDFGIIQSHAILEFETEKGKLAATLGTIKILAPYISLNTGTTTTEEEIVVSGVTIPETEVVIYDGSYRVGTAKSSKSGRWTAAVKLMGARNGSIHDMKAVINEGTTEEKQSNTVNVLYEWSVKVTEFKLYCNNKRKEVNLLAIENPVLSYDPSYPFIFKIRLSDNQKAEEVYVVNTKGDAEHLLKAEYSEEEECWIATARFRSEVPGIFSVRVIEKSPDIKIDKNAEIKFDPSNASDDVKNAKYEEIVNDYDKENGTGNYKGTLTLADDEKTKIDIDITGRELETEDVSEEEILKDGYVKTESTDGSSDYYTKINVLSNGDYEIATIEFQYGDSDAAAKVIEQSVVMGMSDFVGNVVAEIDQISRYGELAEQKVICEASEAIGETAGDAFGLAIDVLGYWEDFQGEDSIYERIYAVYDFAAEAYADGMIPKAEYLEILNSLKSMNDTLLVFQSLKILGMAAGVAINAACPIAGVAYSLVGGIATDYIYGIIDGIYDNCFELLNSILLYYIVDPSGYVYEAVPGNRLEGVTAAIYYQEKDEGGNIYSILWDAEEYEQINPLVTEADGIYAWDVPEGYWKVVFEKEGYESAETEWLPVPPMQTDINIGMVSEKLTSVEQVTIYNDHAILLFDNYVQADSITSKNVKVYSQNREACSFTVETVNGKEQEQGVLASQYLLMFDEKLSQGSYTVEINETIKDYAERNLNESCTITKEVKSMVKEIKAEIPEQIVMGVECMIPITVVTEGNLKDYDIKFVSEAENAFDILGVSDVDENGTFHVKIDPNLPVQVNLDVYVDGLLSERIPLEILINEMQPEPKPDEVIRIYGATRYETGYKAANVLKEKLGVDRFDAVIVATGKNFADALAGSYLSVVKNAPILLTNGKSDNIEILHEYMNDNVAVGGTMYILGGEAAVPKEVESISGYTIKRLSGNTRYDTNIEILKETGMTGDTVIVATGKTFADSLSASAAKLPILLVKPGSTLNAEQKTLLSNIDEIYIVGGEGAVTESYANELSAYGDVERVYGTSRYDTSIEVAKTFFEDVDMAVVASGKNFPDGLCGGPLAAAMGAPLILTADGKTGVAKEYVQEESICAGYVLGGTGALEDTSIVDIFGFEGTN